MITKEKRQEVLKKMDELAAEIGCTARCGREGENFFMECQTGHLGYSCEDLYYTFVAPPLSLLKLKPKEKGVRIQKGCIESQALKTTSTSTCKECHNKKASKVRKCKSQTPRYKKVKC